MDLWKELLPKRGRASESQIMSERKLVSLVVPSLGQYVAEPRIALLISEQTGLDLGRQSTESRTRPSLSQMSVF